MIRIGILERSIFSVILLVAQILARDIKGAINLDQYTFDKVVATHTVFVRFDRQHAYGEKEEIFKDLGLFLGGKATPDDFILAYIGVQEYQEKMSLELAEKRFRITKKDWPAYRLFLKGRPDEPIVYDGPITVDSMIKFLKAEAGLTLRKLGTVHELNQICKEFVAGPADQRPFTLSLAEEIVNRMQDPTTGNWYLRIMEHIIESDLSYVEKETERLKKLKAASQTTEKKIKEFNLRLSVLSRFIMHDEL